MEKEFINGMMEENMKVNILWIKKMGKENITLLMVNDIKEIGKMGNKMAKENKYILTVEKELEYGNKVKG